MATHRVPAQLRESPLASLLCELCRYPSLSPPARPHHVVLSCSQRKSGPPSRRSARTTLDKAPRCAWHCRVRESNSVPPHTHPIAPLAPCDVVAYTRCHRRCVCGRGPVLEAASAHRSVRGTGRDHIPVWPCVSLRQRLSPHRKCRAAEILEAAPNPHHARFQRLQVWCLCFGTVTLGFPAVFCCGDCFGSCCGNCCRCNICDDVC